MELLPAELASRLDRLSLVTRTRLLGSGQGERRSQRRGSSLEFVDYRAYVPGDDPSRVDWNVYGRSGHLQVKLFEAEELLGVSVVLDGSASMRWGDPDKFYRGSQVAAALGYLGLAGGNRVRLNVLHSSGAQRSRAFWGRKQAPDLLRFVSAQVADEPVLMLDEDGGSLGRLVRESQRAVPPASAGRGVQLVILVSDLLSETWRDALQSLQGPGLELVVVHVLDEAEVTPPLSGDLNLVDQETGERVAVTLNAEVASWYEARVQTWLTEVAEFCAQRGVRYGRYLTSGPLEQFMFRDLRLRGVLR